MVICRALRRSAALRGAVRAATRPPQLSTCAVSRCKGGGADDDADGQPKSKLEGLLQDLRTRTLEKQNAESVHISRPKKAKKKGTAAADRKVVDPELADAASSVASHLAKESAAPAEAKEVIESDLLKQLKKLSTETSETRDSRANVTSLVGQMKLEKGQAETARKARAASAAPDAKQRVRALTKEQQAFLDERRRKRREMLAGGVDPEADGAAESQTAGVFTARPLGIFELDSARRPQPDDRVRLVTWEKCAVRNLRIISTPAPRNLLEDMAQMTDRGILWQFPIDNEQGLDPDEMEPFHAHVFLEHHLESWCPKKGPVRQFMELVCTGLQKNPYITVEKKLRHLDWFREYFAKPDKTEILRLAGAID